jgi:hypothetical protein
VLPDQISDWLNNFASLGLSGVGSTLDEDAQAKVVEVSEPESTPLNQFDFVVDTFSKGIRPTFDKIVQDEFEPVFQCHQKRLKCSHALLLNLFYPMA